MPAPEELRTLADLRKYLHSYRIKHPGQLELTARASIIITGIDNLAEGPEPDRAYMIMADMHRAARELADLDETMGWLAIWKPRVAVSAVAKDGGT